MNTNSQLAHQKSMNFKEKHHEKIVNVLKQISRPLTYKQIAEYSGLDATAVGRRLKELVDDEKIQKLESRICTIAKSRCATYTV